jgi:cell division protease FtsH
MDMKRRIRSWLPVAIQAAIFILLVLLLRFSLVPQLRGGSVQHSSYSEFLQAVRDGRVASAEIRTTEIRGVLRDQPGKSKSGEQHILVAVRPPNLEDPELLPLLKEKKVEIVGKVDTPSWWRGLLFSAFPMILLLGFWA